MSAGGRGRGRGGGGGGPHRKPINRHTKLTITWDEAERNDFVTGFHKRKVQRRQYAETRKQELEAAQKRDARKAKREGQREREAQGAWLTDLDRRQRGTPACSICCPPRPRSLRKRSSRSSSSRRRMTGGCRWRRSSGTRWAPTL